MRKPSNTTIVALRLTPRVLNALAEACNAQEIIPPTEQAAVHFLCKGMGIADREPEEKKDTVTKKK